MTDRRPLHLPGAAPAADADDQAAPGRPRLLPIERAQHPAPEPEPEAEVDSAEPAPRARRPLGRGFLAEGT